jgi:hypothetical protein
MCSGRAAVCSTPPKFATLHPHTAVTVPWYSMLRVPLWRVWHDDNAAAPCDESGMVTTRLRRADTRCGRCSLELSRAFQSWVEFLEQQHDKADSMRRAVGLMLNFKLAAAFRQWHDLAVEQRVIKAVALKVVQRLQGRSLLQARPPATSGGDRDVVASSCCSWLWHCILDGRISLAPESKKSARPPPAAQSPCAWLRLQCQHIPEPEHTTWVCS